MEQFSIPALANRVQTEADAYAFLEELRWPNGPVCPHCGNDRAYFLKPREGQRKTTRGTGTDRRLWKCAACRKQFSVLTGTIFHGTHIPVKTWLFVVFAMCSSKNGVSAREIERTYGLTPKSAWFMLHRIREAMKRDPLVGMLSGVIVSDEAWIGGKPKNKHQHGRPSRLPEGGRGRAGTPKHMVPVLSLVSRETGEVRTRVIPDITGPTLRKAIAEQVDMENSVLHTDSAPAYKPIGVEFQAHHAVDHSKSEYVRYIDGDHAGTNQAEGYFSQLKRSIDGTHHHVSRVHLDRYLAEFDYRYSTRKLSDTARMKGLMGQVEGKRLTYKPLRGR